jgi:hypothetical protein
VSFLDFCHARRPNQLLPSNLTVILQYGSRPSSDFLAKILGVHTSPFVWNKQFYFTRSSLLLHKSCVGHQLLLSAVAQWVVCLLMVRTTHIQFPKYYYFLFFFFFNHHVYNGYGDHNISLTFKSLHLHFLSSFTDIHDREEHRWFLKK